MRLSRQSWHRAEGVPKLHRKHQNGTWIAAAFVTANAKTIRFAGFSVDLRRASLLDSAGGVRKLRPKSFDMLCFLLQRPGQVVAKDDLLLGVWGHTNLDDDGLTQCARDIRVALDDTSRVLLKTIPRRGYLLEAGPIEYEADPCVEEPEPHSPPLPPTIPAVPEPARGGTRVRSLAVIASLVLLGSIVAVGFLLRARLEIGSPTLVLYSINASDAEPETAAIAASVTDRLMAGLSLVPAIHLKQVSTSEPPTSRSSRTPPNQRELHGAVSREAGSLALRLRVVDAGTQETIWATTAEISLPDLDERRRNMALVGKAGAELARFLNQWTLGPYPDPPSQATRLTMDEARSYLEHISRERQRRAEDLYRQALRSDPGSMEIKLSLARTQLIASVNHWYDLKDREEKARSIQTLVDEVLLERPGDYSALQANCMAQRSSGHREAALLACSAVLKQDPWNIRAMKERGYAELLLGRLGDALETFETAEDTDPTAPLSWTWREGAGLACLLLDRDAEAADWLARSALVAPGTGRTDLLLAVAYARLGRQRDAASIMTALRAANYDIRDSSLPVFASGSREGQSMERLQSTIDRLAELR